MKIQKKIITQSERKSCPIGFTGRKVIIMKKKFFSVIISAAIAASTFTATAFAAPETDLDFLLKVGDTVEPFDEDGESGYRFEVIRVDTADEDIFYTMRLIDSDYDITVRISDTDLWDIGFSQSEDGKI